MKILVFTKHYVKNYGSVLQTLATQEILGRFSDDVTIANYVRPEAIGTNFTTAILKNRKTKNPIIRFIYQLILYPTIRKWERVFGDFVTKHLKITSPICTSEKEIKEKLPVADVYCTGSDMVWNDETNEGFLPAYFLRFAPDSAIRMSFAASFGKDSFTIEQQGILKEYLKKYKAISVREKSGVDIIAGLGLKAEHVLDPSLCLDKEYWKRFVGKNKYGDYLLIYQLTSSRKFDEYAKKLAKKYGVKILRICTRYDNITKCGHPVIIPTVEEWITLFWHAKYIVTDSFHGTAFAINLNKEVLALPPRQYAGRLQSILSLLNIEERFVENYDAPAPFDTAIDYTVVNRRLEKERQKTIMFLRDAIEE